jgi:hypothetical protein
MMYFKDLGRLKVKGGEETGHPKKAGIDVLLLHKIKFRSRGIVRVEE